MDKNLYDLEPERPQGSASVRVARRGARSPRPRPRVLTGGVFTDDMIDAYMGLKMEAVTRFRMTTHPVEYEMYLSL
jgi:glutamine synthetase